MGEIILAAATGNINKIREIQAVLGPLGARVVTAAEAGAPDGFAPEENGVTFEENSRIKAEALMEALSRAGAARDGCGRAIPAPRVDGVIADDSGLCVDALGGAPGVYSARFADMPPAARDGGGPDERNNAKLLGLLEGVPYAARTARFVCVVTLLVRCGEAEDPEEAAGGSAAKEIVCRGECEGRIAFGPRGGNGFGYDPLFIPSGEDGPVADGAAGRAGDDAGARTFGEMPPGEKNAVSHRARALAKLYGALSESGLMM
jgi:XTP/dITP diphosphohydrolase